MSYGDPRYQYRENNGINPALLVRLLPILIGAALIGMTALKGCQQGPFGRVQVVGMDTAQESKLGLQAFKEALSNAHVIRQGAAVEAVREIAKRLIRSTQNAEFQHMIGTKPPEFKWELEVVDDKQVNAFCLPGGKIVVYTSILPVAETDSGLATVVGHEISHALAHHGAERMAQQQMVQIGLSSAGATMGDMDPASRRQVLSILNAGANFGILSYSRKHETEADHMGLLLMAAAGYDPEESIRFWERMMHATSGAGAPPEFMSTHPSHQTRIADLKRWMPEALKLYNASQFRSETKVLPGMR